MEISFVFDAIHTEKDLRRMNVALNKMHEQSDRIQRALKDGVKQDPIEPYDLELPGGVVVKNVVGLHNISTEGVYRTGQCYKVSLTLHTQEEKEEEHG